MGRPSGQFARNRDSCLTLIKQLSGVGYCIASDQYLSDRLGVKPRQVSRYIADLKKSGKIEVTTSSGKRDPTLKRFFRTRKIVIKLDLPSYFFYDTKALQKQTQEVESEETTAPVSQNPEELKVLLSRFKPDEGFKPNPFVDHQAIDNIVKELEAEMSANEEPYGNISP